MTAGDTTRTGIIFKAMASVSSYTLTPAYYEICLEGKYMRDSESAEMINIILSTRNFDLGFINNWGGLFGLLIEMYDSRINNFASAYEQRADKAQAEMDEFVKEITGEK